MDPIREIHRAQQTHKDMPTAEHRYGQGFTISDNLLDALV